jgi:prepilin-type processing-associated H-X9-DG protein
MMPTMFARGDGAPCRIGNWGGNGYDIKPGDQVWFWAYPLRTYLGDATDWSSSSALSRAVSTPRVYDEGRYSFTCDGLTYELTAEFAGASYAHCPTLFTSASAWTGERVPDLSGVSEPVSAALIRSPSDKTNLVTVRTFYAENAPLASALPNDRANWLACDGHAETIGVGDLRRGIPFGCSCFENRTALGVAYPGLGTPGGVYGRDR